MSEQYLILLDPHLTQSKLFRLLNDAYRVQVYGGISDLPVMADQKLIVSKWQLVDGEAVDIPSTYREKLIVMDEGGSVEAWLKCKQARICYVSDLETLLTKIRSNYEGNSGMASSTVEQKETQRQEQGHEQYKQRTTKPLDEPITDPFMVQMDEPEDLKEKKLEQKEKQPIKYSPPTKGGKEVIVVTQKKGGTGKTTVTETAARIIAERGQKVLVIELDPDGGHLASRLNLSSKGTINLLNHGYSMESIIESRTDKAMTIDFILSPDFSKREVIPPRVVEALIQQAQQDYDVLMIDCGTAWDDTIQAAVGMATQIWMVSTPDHAALHDGRVLYTKLIQSEIEPDKIYHIINKAAKSKGISLQEVQSNVPVANVYLLPEDPKVEQIQRLKKEPIDCAFGKKMREMVKDVVPFQLEDEEEERTSWWLRIPILRRLFG